MLWRADKVLISWSDSVQGVSGRDLKDIAKEMGCSIDEACDRLQPAGAIYFMMDEKDVQSAMAHPGAMIGSDGIPFDTTRILACGAPSRGCSATTRAISSSFRSEDAVRA